MLNNLEVFVADSSGNTTIFVLSPVNIEDYVYVAQRLLALDCLAGEQVAFILSSGDTSSVPCMNMCGMEFCGNATRAFALYESLLHNPPLTDVSIKVSGVDATVSAHIDVLSGNVSIQLPVPDSFKVYSSDELPIRHPGTFVNCGGISHLIVEDIPPMLQTFEDLKDFFYLEYDSSLPAFGVMFYDTVNQLMTPVVYVKDVDSTYFEGSCASGTLSAAYAFSQKKEDGIHRYSIEQPNGVLEASIHKRNGIITEIYLSGPVRLSEKIKIEL